MEHLYTPWRSRYISEARNKKVPCIFCKFLKANRDEGNLVVHRARKSFVVMNLFPYNDGHLMVCPNRHAGEPGKLNADEWMNLNETLKQTLAVLRKVLNPDGFNVGMNLGKVSGAGIADHFHIHAVPRWLGDTNFMPVLGETKMINQDLQKLYARLRTGFCSYTRSGF